jgi:hypothetical protein
MGAGAGNGAPGTSEGFDGGLDHSTLVIAGVTMLGLIMAVLDATIVNVAVDRQADPDGVGRAVRAGVEFCARSRRAIGSRDGGPAHAAARMN